MKKSLLIAEDDIPTLDLLRKAFQRDDLTVHIAKNGSEALQVIDHSPVDVVLTDIKMPGADGMEVLSYTRKVRPAAEVVVMTGYATVESAVQAMKLGAFHYITKPFDVEEVVHLIDRIIEVTSVRKENIQLKTQVRTRFGPHNIIGDSPAIHEVLSLVKKVADTDSTILVMGESGTGKELIARAIHYMSPRSERMLVPINCSAIPADLLESELFGHVKGAFTGAHVARMGRFETAHNGTLFLDEIGEMSPHLQAKLLRVLQERSFIPVGGNRNIDVDVRVIAATNKNLEKEISAGRFRQDLYFRLNVIPIHLPPLRERTEDIPVLADHFIGKYSQKSGRSIHGFRPEAMEAMKDYSWPGNVRELENLVERLAVLSRDGWFEWKDLPPVMRLGGDGGRAKTGNGLQDGTLDLRKATADFENGLIREALALSRGNKNRAAALLGLKRTTFLEMLKRKGLNRR